MACGGVRFNYKQNNNVTINNHVKHAHTAMQTAAQIYALPKLHQLHNITLILPIQMGVLFTTFPRPACARSIREKVRALTGAKQYDIA